MRFFTALWSWLTIRKAKPADVGNPDLNPIDVKALALSLNLRAEAKRLGLAGLPSTTSGALSGPEAAVVQAVEKMRSQYVAWSSMRLSILNEAIARWDVTADVQRALTAEDSFNIKARDLYAEQKSDLESLKESAAKSQKKLHEFRLAHQLDRDAQYPPPGKKFLLGALVGICLLIEAIVNGFYFAEGNRNGILGGMGQAAIFAALNILVAFSIGNVGIRQLFHRGTFRRFLGALSLIAFIFATVCIALLITHMRNAFAAEALEPEKAAYLSLMALGSPFSGIQSILLFCVSVFFACVGMLDGLAFDDKYPGYGDIQRAAMKCREEFEHDVQAMREDLIDLRQQHLDAFEQQIKDCQGRLALSVKEIDNKDALSARLSQAILDVDNSMQALLKDFQTENEVHRNGLPAPAYFGKTHALSPLPLPSLDTNADRRSLQEQDKLVKILLDRAQDVRQRIQLAFESHIVPIESFEQAFMSREVR